MILESEGTRTYSEKERNCGMLQAGSNALLPFVKKGWETNGYIQIESPNTNN